MSVTPPPRVDLKLIVRQINPLLSNNMTKGQSGVAKETEPPKTHTQKSNTNHHTDDPVFPPVSLSVQSDASSVKSSIAVAAEAVEASTTRVSGGKAKVSSVDNSAQLRRLQHDVFNCVTKSRQPGELTLRKSHAMPIIPKTLNTVEKQHKLHTDSD